MHKATNYRRVLALWHQRVHYLLILPSLLPQSQQRKRERLHGLHAKKVLVRRARKAHGRILVLRVMAADRPTRVVKVAIVHRATAIGPLIKVARAATVRLAMAIGPLIKAVKAAVARRVTAADRRIKVAKAVHKAHRAAVLLTKAAAAQAEHRVPEAVLLLVVAAVRVAHREIVRAAHPAHVKMKKNPKPQQEAISVPFGTASSMSRHLVPKRIEKITLATKTATQWTAEIPGTDLPKKHPFSV